MNHILTRIIHKPLLINSIPPALRASPLVEGGHDSPGVFSPFDKGDTAKPRGINEVPDMKTSL